MKFAGIIKAVEEKNGTTKDGRNWTILSAVIEELTDRERPQIAVVDITDPALIGWVKTHEGAGVTATALLFGHQDAQGRWFNSIKCYAMTQGGQRVGVAEAPQGRAYQPESAPTGVKAPTFDTQAPIGGYNDDLPFD